MHGWLGTPENVHLNRRNRGLGGLPSGWSAVPGAGTPTEDPFVHV